MYHLHWKKDFTILVTWTFSIKFGKRSECSTVTQTFILVSGIPDTIIYLILSSHHKAHENYWYNVPGSCNFQKLSFLDTLVGASSIEFMELFLFFNAQKMQFFIKDFFSECGQIRSKLCAHVQQKGYSRTPTII